MAAGARFLQGKQLLGQFFDERAGGCYLYAADGEQLFLRPKDTYDGAMPSGNSVAALVFSRLSALTAEESWRQAAEKQQAFMTASASQAPEGSGFFLWQLAEAEASRGQLVITAGEGRPVRAAASRRASETKAGRRGQNTGKQRPACCRGAVYKGLPASRAGPEILSLSGAPVLSRGGQPGRGQSSVLSVKQRHRHGHGDEVSHRLCQKHSEHLVLQKHRKKMNQRDQNQYLAERWPESRCVFALPKAMKVCWQDTCRPMSMTVPR